MTPADIAKAREALKRVAIMPVTSEHHAETKRLRALALLAEQSSQAAEIPYEPTIIDLPDAGLREFVLRDCATIHRHGEHYDTLVDMENGEVIGFAWPIDTNPALAPKAPPSASKLKLETTGEQREIWQLDPDDGKYAPVDAKSMWAHVSALCRDIDYLKGRIAELERDNASLVDTARQNNETIERLIADRDAWKQIANDYTAILAAERDALRRDVEALKAGLQWIASLDERVGMNIGPAIRHARSVLSGQEKGGAAT